MEINGTRIKLLPLTVHHADALLQAAADGKLWTLPFTVVPNKETIAEYISVALRGFAEGTVIPFVIEIKTAQQIVGCTRFWKIDVQNKKLEIGHTWIGVSWQKTYVNTEVKYLMLKYAFEELRCVRVQFTTDVLNEKSRAAILRIGAIEEGVIRNERIMPDGRKRNSVRYSIIEDEWKGVKENLKILMKRNAG